MFVCVVLRVSFDLVHAGVIEGGCMPPIYLRMSNCILEPLRMNPMAPPKTTRPPKVKLRCVEPEIFAQGEVEMRGARNLGHDELTLWWSKQNNHNINNDPMN